MLRCESLFQIYLSSFVWLSRNFLHFNSNDINKISAIQVLRRLNVAFFVDLFMCWENKWNTNEFDSGIALVYYIYDQITFLANLMSMAYSKFLNTTKIVKCNFKNVISKCCSMNIFLSFYTLVNTILFIFWSISGKGYSSSSKCRICVKIFDSIFFED